MPRLSLRRDRSGRPDRTRAGQEAGPQPDERTNADWDGGREDDWVQDVLGPGFEARRIPVAGRGAHDAATLVRYLPRQDPDRVDQGRVERDRRGTERPATERSEDGGPRRDPGGTWEAPRGTVIYVHGWSDYFANPELARTVAAAGFRFYAVDLHGYGRALTDDVLAAPDVPGYAESMREYREDLQAAARAAADDGAPARPEQIVWIGHSTGGLVIALAELTARRPPAGVALVTPWIASHAHDATGRVLVALLRLIPRRWHERALPIRLTSSYYRSLAADAEGEWPLDPRWRPESSFPLTVGFLLAAHQGHVRLRRLHRAGHRIQAPVLLQTARRSLLLPWWTEAARHRDTVLDVRQVRRRIGTLSPVPRVISYDGALHDVHRSLRPVRQRAFADLSDWLDEVGRRIG